MKYQGKNPVLRIGDEVINGMGSWAFESEGVKELYEGEISFSGTYSPEQDLKFESGTPVEIRVNGEVYSGKVVSVNEPGQDGLIEIILLDNEEKTL